MISVVPASKLKFSIAIVNYKTLALTKTCLELLKKHFAEGLLDKSRIEVWVVDNYSQDESTQYLRTQASWINLIERERPLDGEEGIAAHGRALDLIMEKISTDYVFLMHSDTFIYRPEVFAWLLNKCSADKNVAAVGCLEQLNRGYLRRAWRIGSRFFKYYSRRLKLEWGIKARPPKPYVETYIKSFFAVWNVQLIKQQGLSFFMADRIPGYELQDRLKASNYKICTVSPMRLFQYLDHVEAGTVGLVQGYSSANRRIQRMKNLLSRFNQLP